MNRTSKTRSASSGTPYLKPKLMSWMASRSGSDGVAEPREDALAQLAQRQVRRVDDDVGLGADGIQEAPLLDDRGGDAALVGQRVAVAGLGEAPDEHLVTRFEEEDLRPDAAPLERAAHRPEGDRGIPRPDVEDDRDLVEPLAIVRDELREIGQELARQIVDDGVAEILEQLRGRRLAATGQAGDDRDVLLFAESRLGRFVGVLVGVV